MPDLWRWADWFERQARTVTRHVPRRLHSAGASGLSMLCTACHFGAVLMPLGTGAKGAITITGLDKLFHKLDTAAATKTLEPPMQRGVLRLQRPMQVYPPQPAHSLYRRIGTY